MAFIPYLDIKDIPQEDRITDGDNILRIHGIHSKVMKQHFEIYKQLMYKKGPLSRAQRELIAVVVSVENKCNY